MIDIVPALFLDKMKNLNQLFLPQDVKQIQSSFRILD